MTTCPQHPPAPRLDDFGTWNDEAGAFEMMQAWREAHVQTVCPECGRERWVPVER